MRRRRLSDVAEVLGGRMVGEDVTVASVVVDSRRASDGSLFFALRGENTHGHAFVADAISAGSSAAVVSDPGALAGPGIVVPDVLEALSVLAADERRNSDAKVVGITGSTGKTSTKDLVTAVLSSRLTVRGSAGSFNNEVGLPLTILEATEETDVLVCEMGARGIGHIAKLAEVASPDVGIVTNVGVAHIEMFGSKDNIARAKGELVEALDEAGTAILSADDAVVRGFADRTSARVVTFGTSADADVRAEGVELGPDGCAAFTMAFDRGSEPVQLAVAGEHMVPNALAAAAAGLSLGLSLSRVAESLRDARISRWRMETFTTASGVVVINDAYNANPTSMAAALKTARWIARDTRMGAVLGQMAELGAHSREEHERVGELAARLHIDRLVTVGTDSLPLALAAVREGVEPESVASYEGADEALDDIRRWAMSGDVVLFKASRVVGLERLAEAMR
jgi:UDP-N-acetylmuramoyl-tripeptide--D-alanyl-D-alanine ligase